MGCTDQPFQEVEVKALCQQMRLLHIAYGAPS